MDVRRRDNIPVYCFIVGTCLGIIFSGALLLLRDWAFDKVQSEDGLEVLVAGLTFLIMVAMQITAVELTSSTPTGPSARTAAEDSLWAQVYGDELKRLLADPSRDKNVGEYVWEERAATRANRAVERLRKEDAMR